jgi:guanine nucleotide-binding protein subunit gamma
MSQQKLQNNPKIQEKLQQLKLKRLDELNNNLKELLAKDRIYASNASYTIINQVVGEKDYALPEISGYMNPGENPLRSNVKLRGGRSLGSSDGGAGCCTIM